MILTIFIVVITVLAVMMCILLLFPLIRVCGDSMSPTLLDGEYLIGTRLFNKKSCEIGGVYVFRPPYDSEDRKYVIKRLHHIRGGKYFFIGDNPECSYDSRNYGYVDSKNIVAKIVTRR